MKWSFVPNTKGRFSVSCTGKVRKNATNEILTPKKSHEYDVVNIEGVRWYVHVLVLTVFVGPRPKGKKRCIVMTIQETMKLATYIGVHKVRICMMRIEMADAHAANKA